MIGLSASALFADEKPHITTTMAGFGLAELAIAALTDPKTDFE